MTDLPPSALNRLEVLMRQYFGGQPFYIAKRGATALEAASEIDLQMTAAEIAAKLGVTVRHARRVLKRRMG